MSLLKSTMCRILTSVVFLSLVISILCSYSMAQGGSENNSESKCANNTEVNTNCHFKKGSPKPSFPNDGKLRLYSMRFCPYSHRAHLVLNAKNISYNIAYINLVNKPEWFYQVNPRGQTPTLNLINEPNQPFLIDSMIIVEYLDEKFPELKLYPSDPLEKAQTKLWIKRFNTLDVAYHKLAYKKNEDDVNEQLLNTIYVELETYETELKKRGTNYFGGATPGILDYAIWPWFERLGILEAIVGDKYNFDDRFSKLSQWVQLTKEDSAVKKHFVSTDIHTKYTLTVRDGNPNYNILV
ncbi:pyrimidodiazepine synthase-like [Contarinia nasturtii]|uniref:pyrimidodiazepine synthase-like n=1 Tax=Contarinia nasturtii TaxID=265458 RepID=UPI0012D418CA|nr:pyrimidodiazepine synthase-like [Contarinia nasturtii]